MKAYRPPSLSPSDFLSLPVCLSHTATFPGGMFLESVVLQVVVQEREVVVERDGPAASPSWTFFVQLLVVSQIVQDLVVVGLCIRARTAAVPKDHLLPGLVAQPEVRNVQVDLAEQASSARRRDRSQLLLAAFAFP